MFNVKKENFCCVLLYCFVLYCIALYCIVLYCIVLYCIVLNSYTSPLFFSNHTYNMQLLGTEKTTLKLFHSNHTDIFSQLHLSQVIYSSLLYLYIYFHFSYFFSYFFFLFFFLRKGYAFCI